ncbi:MAG: hypothetical protein NTX17_00880 [Candidatus Eisenbacteria bacterium]|nr:hypothetical protein [Candidatus Eisenbacteria bacterium]
MSFYPAKIFVVSANASLTASLRRHLRHGSSVETCGILVSDDPHGDVLGTFRQISNALEKHPASILRNSTALLEIGFSEDELIKQNLLVESGDPVQTLGAMLISAFPEIRWVFPRTSDHFQPVSEVRDGSATLARRLLCGAAPISPMFDPEGTRDALRQQVLIDDNTRGLVPHFGAMKRDDIGASIDDEEAYAYLHAYLSFRLGYRCYIVTTLRGLSSFRDDRQIASFTFEDFFLNFPDRSGLESETSLLGERDIGLSNLAYRDDVYRALGRVTSRVFVTVGHRYTIWHEQNRMHIKKLKASGKTVKVVYKPCAGMYRLLAQSGLLRDYWKRRNREWSACHPTIGRSGSHSAPGRLLFIADSLIERAERVYETAQSVPDCIHGALLALEAQELLGYRTPTTSLEAIALRHKLEVKAECMFQGMEYNIDVKNRLHEVEQEVKAGARWFSPSVRRRSALNAEMSVVTEIMRIFNHYGQFDEEQSCLKRLRKLNRESYFLKHPLLISLRPIRWYIETLLASFPLFVLAVALWPLILGILSWALKANFACQPNCSYPHITNAYVLFLGHTPVGQPLNPAAQCLTVFISLIGFVHLGIFIAYLYTLVSRK